MELPEFLQSKQNVQPIKQGLFASKKTLSVVVLSILLLAIPLTVWLAQRSQIFAPKAQSAPIELVAEEGSCVISTNPNKVNCPTFPVKLTSPLDPNATPSGTPSPHAEPSLSPSPSASASASLAPSPSSSTPSASPTNIASCMSTALGLSTPLTFANKNNTTILYWKSVVSLAQLTSAATQCGASMLNPTNFSSDAFETFVRSNSGATTRSVLVEGPCSAQKVQAYRDGGVKVSADVQCDGPDINLDYKVYATPNTFDGIGDFGGSGDPAVVIPASSASAGSFLASIFSQLINVINPDQAFAQDSSPSPSPASSPSASPSASPATSPSSSPSASASASLAPSPSSSPSVPPGHWAVFYKIAETEAGLETAPILPYDNDPLFTDFTFIDTTPGAKQVWVEFIGGDGSFVAEHIAVELVEPDPVLTSLDCSMDISKQNLKLTLNGSRLGNTSGKVTANTKEAQILTWNATQVTATIKPTGNLEEGQEFKVVLTKSDGKVFPEIVCQVNTTLISLGARLFCREPGKFDVNGVKVTLVDENGNKVNEEVTISADGVIKGLKTKLQVGKTYVVSIKAPFSLRRNGVFIAANGTNLVTPEEGSIFILPVGDIAPVILPDGKINTLDRSEIVRQWSVLGTNTRTGDFNRDTKVNSIDWACMRFDFNNEDDKIPDKAAFPSASPTPGSSLTPSGVPSSSVSPTPVASSSPQASGISKAFFLLEPVEGGSYPNDDEFIVNINISSQNEAANLFVAKISFDPAALEVVRIEKGTILTSWAEEFFDNPTGKISLVAGLPNPGLKTTEGEDPLMAKIIFKGKSVGNTDISVTSDSKIYSNANNSNLLSDLIVQGIAITN